FYSQIEPIFGGHCYGCHAEAYSEANFRLDVKASAFRGGNSGAVILPGNSKDSILIHRVLGLNGLRRMPPAGAPLSAEEVETLRRWIDQGANWPDTPRPVTAIQRHWAYEGPVRPIPPQVTNKTWIRNPIDNFVLARLEREGLHP